MVVEAAAFREDTAGKTKTRIAGNKVADLSTNSQQRNPSLEVQPAAVLECAFVLRSANVVAGPASSDADPG
jgi:hypothetical protein